jgi:CheY-like chemotaxis protein
MSQNAHHYRASSLLGLKILIVEDEFFTAAALAEYLRDAGAKSADSAATVAEGKLLVEQSFFAGAILDIRLGRELVFPLADRLDEKRIPFVFHSADFFAVPPRFSQVPQVHKAHGFESVATSILLIIAKERAGLAGDDIDTIGSTDQVLRALRGMARGLVANSAAADEIVEEALRRSFALVESGASIESLPRHLVRLVEQLWLEQKLSRPS